MATTPAEPRRSRSPAALAALLAALLYLPTLFAGYCRDDEVQLDAAGPIVQGDWPALLASHYWAGTEETGNLYRPLTTVSLAVESLLAGEGPHAPRPGVHHAVNLGLHAAAAALGVALLAAFGLAGRPLLLAGWWLALHPARADAVCEAVQRAEILAFLGMGGALLAALRWRAGGSWRALGAVFGCALGGLLAKESAASLVLLLPLVAWLVPGSGKPWWPAHLVAMAGVAIYLALRAAVLGGMGTALPVSPLDNPVAGASTVERLATAAAVVPEYARLALWPWRLSPDYAVAAVAPAGSWFDPAVLLGVAVALAAAAGLARGRRAPAVALGFGWIAAALGPFANVVFPMGYLVAERALYAPLLGVALLLGAALDRFGPGRLWPWAVATACVAVAGARTAARAVEWRAPGPLYEAAAAAGSRSARVWFVVGTARARGPDPDAADRALATAVECWPDYAQAWSARASLAERRGDEAAAEAFHARAEATAEAWDHRPALNHGVFLARRDELPAAIVRFRDAAHRQPRVPGAWVNLVQALHQSGQTGEARDALAEAAAQGVRDPALDALATRIR